MRSYTTFSAPPITNGHPNGESVNIHFAPKDRQCVYDVRVVWTDGDEADWRKFDLCTVSHITLYWNNGKATAEYE